MLAIAAPTGAAERRLDSGHLSAALRDLKVVGELAETNRLNLTIGLPLRQSETLSNLLAQIYNPASLHYHHYLTPAEFVAQYAPTEADYEAVQDFARTNHFTVTGRHGNRMLLDVSASLTDIESAFHVRLRMYHQPLEDRDFFAPDKPPSVDEQIPILDVAGLDNYRLPQPLLRRASLNSNLIHGRSNTGSAPGGYYIGNDFRAAYLPGVLLNGAGQTVGLVEFDGFYAADIASYEQQAGLPSVPLQMILLDNFNGIPTTAMDNGNTEVSLDIELAVSMAPGLSNVMVYEAGPNGSPNDVLNRIATDDRATQIGCSWGWTGGPSATTDQIFQQMAAQGQSFFCASGDTDAYSPGSVDDPDLDNAPSDSPYITVVGGTVLTTSGPGGSWDSETVWNEGDGTGSSGGISSDYSIPSWQQGIGNAGNGCSTLRRNIPDVALTADNVYVVYNQGSSGHFGGTSCAAALWAGFMALANQQAAAYGHPPSGFLNPAIYSIGQGSTYALAFHDITSGNNADSSSPTAFYATAGYDLCTGWGTPNGAGLINALSPLDPLGILPLASLSSFGPAGGPFNPQSETFVLTNSGVTAIHWSMSASAPWLAVAPAGGVLGGGASVSVLVRLNASAASLGPGSHTNSLWVTNLVTGFGQRRQFLVQVDQSLVQNGGFEYGSFSDWAFSGATNYSMVTSSSAYVHSGNYGFQLGPFQTFGYLSQTLPTVAGQLYLLSLWLDNPGAGTPNECRVSWNGATLFDQVNIPALSWTNLQFLVTASGSASLLQLGFRDDPAFLGLDDVSVSPVSSPAVQAFWLNGGTPQFAVGATPGLIYQMQCQTNLGETNWTSLGPPVAATNPILIFSDPGPVNPQRFYRISVQP